MRKCVNCGKELGEWEIGIKFIRDTYSCCDCAFVKGLGCGESCKSCKSCGYKNCVETTAIGAEKLGIQVYLRR